VNEKGILPPEKNGFNRLFITYSYSCIGDRARKRNNEKWVGDVEENCSGERQRWETP
jgi:hypothetical protein